MDPFKRIKSYIDDNLRIKVTPIPGSVVYTDLDGKFECSGIIGEDGRIITLKNNSSNSTIIVSSSIKDFIKRSNDKKVYVSSNSLGAVGNINVALGVKKHLGEEDMYNYIFENCHNFSQKCLFYSTKQVNNLEKLNFVNIITNADIDYKIPYTQKEYYNVIGEDNEISLISLKKTANERIGATKWLLWNLGESSKKLDQNIDKEIEKYKDIKLNEENIKEIEEQKKEIEKYLKEIRDENIDERYLMKILRILEIFNEIEKKYEEIKNIIKIIGGGFSLNELKNFDLKELNQIVKELKDNSKIKKLVEKLGRSIKSDKEEEKITKKRSDNIKEEIYGVTKGDDIARLLSSELANLCDEDMENIFYIKLYEKSLLNYSLSGIEEKIEKKEKKATKGPIIVALDTSGSMYGKSLIKSKALLLSICNILQKENRKLYVLLFGEKNQIKEKSFESLDEKKDIISFVNLGFGGGTNFDTPLKRGINILKNSPGYEKADILMITDGECEVSENIKKEIKKEKEALKFNISTVITIENYNKENDGFSDEIIQI